MNVSVYQLLMMIENQPIDVIYSLWGLAGQSHFQPFHAQFFQGTSGLIIVCDLTRETNFAHLPKWVHMADQFHISLEVIIVLGNKRI